MRAPAHHHLVLDHQGDELLAVHQGRVSSAMIPVELRFRGDLAGFLRRPMRGAATVRRSLRGRTAVKDVIEACGVPNPEVDLILTVLWSSQADFPRALLAGLAESALEFLGPRLRGVAIEEPLSLQPSPVRCLVPACGSGRHCDAGLVVHVSEFLPSLSVGVLTATLVFQRYSGHGYPLPVLVFPLIPALLTRGCLEKFRDRLGFAATAACVGLGLHRVLLAAIVRPLAIGHAATIRCKRRSPPGDGYI